MAIRYIHGNLLSSKAQVLVNTVNTYGVMGTGIALQFKQRYPIMYNKYRIACGDSKTQPSLGCGPLQPGMIWRWHILDADGKGTGRYVFNVATKADWRDPSQLAWIEGILQRIILKHAEQPFKSIALPHLGCGNGKLAWAEVKPLIERYLGGIDGLDVQVYSV